MEKRPEHKDNDENAADMRLAYKSSVNGRKDWSQKAIVDLPNTFGTGNPYVTANESGKLIWYACIKEKIFILGISLCTNLITKANNLH